jgi:hypothetical protein
MPFIKRYSVMSLMIDAWLERTDPRIRLIDAQTGQEMLYLGAEQVHQLIETGDLCVSDLSDNTRPCLELLQWMAKRQAVGRDPTRLRAPVYLQH